MEYMATTGLDSLKGADVLKVAPGKYSSEIKYPDTPIARKLKGIAQVHFADLGTRVFYCDHGSFDTHAGRVRSTPTFGPRQAKASRPSHTALQSAPWPGFWPAWVSKLP